MKEISHKGLARLVGSHGTIQLEQEIIDVIVNASIEPDQINRQKIKENFMNILTVPLEWIQDHGVHAKELAINSINEAHEAKKIDNIGWSRSLGWAFHYITDWGTPHHSPNAKSNPIITSTKIGVTTGAIVGGIGGLIKGMTKSNTNYGDILSDISTGAGIGAGIGAGAGAGAGAIGLANRHENFEDRCDELWKEHVLLIKEKLIAKVRHQELPEHLELMIEIFEEMMNSLRQLSENLPVNWIETCTSVEYVEYMVEIALVMNFACQIVIRNN